MKITIHDRYNGYSRSWSPTDDCINIDLNKTFNNCPNEIIIYINKTLEITNLVEKIEVLSSETVYRRTINED